MALPKLFKETNVFKKNAIVNGITDAAKRATSYVTDLTNGIFVHPENDTSNGVQIQGTVEIIQNGDSVAEYGSTTRVGFEDQVHLSLQQTEVHILDQNANILARIAPYGLGISEDLVSLVHNQGYGILTAFGADSSAMGVMQVRGVAKDANNNTYIASIATVATPSGDKSVYCNGDFYINNGRINSIDPNGTITFTTPTVASSRCTVDNGGFYKEGRRVFVEMRLTNAYSRTSTSRTYVQFLSGFPKPMVGAVAIEGFRSTSSTVTEGVEGYINSSGAFYILNSNGMAFTSGDTFTFTGSYFTMD